MDLLEYEDKRRLRREEAAAVLRSLADALERHNGVEITRDGLRYAIEVPDEVGLEVEVEVGDESSIEVEISW